MEVESRLAGGIYRSRPCSTSIGTYPFSDANRYDSGPLTQRRNLSFGTLHVKDRRLVRDPCSDIERSALPRIDTREMRFLDREEIDALASAIDPFYRPFVLVAAATGLRYGELAGLRVKHLDQLHRLIHVQDGMTDVEGRVSFGPLKTRASRRTLSVPGFVVDLLAEHLAARIPVGSDDLVFTGRNGFPVRASNFRQRFWVPAVELSVGQPSRFHDLRHSHAALLIQAGVHPKVIQRRLGHSSIKTTLDTYGHVFEGLDEEASAAFETTWNGREQESRVETNRPRQLPRLNQ